MGRAVKSYRLDHGQLCHKCSSSDLINLHYHLDMPTHYLQGSGTQDWAESLYYNIAKDALARAQEASTMEPGNKAEWERKKAVASVIVFCALCLEAFINKQYFLGGIPLARHVAHKDRWLRLSQLIDNSNRTFDEQSDLFKTFSALIDFRNKRLIHFKPDNEGSRSNNPPLRAWADEIGDVAQAEKYFNMVTALVEELNRLTQGQTEKAGNSIHNEYIRDVWASVTCSVVTD